MIKILLRAQPQVCQPGLEGETHRHRCDRRAGPETCFSAVRWFIRSFRSLVPFQRSRLQALLLPLLGASTHLKSDIKSSTLCRCVHHHLGAIAEPSDQRIYKICTICLTTVAPLFGWGRGHHPCTPRQGNSRVGMFIRFEV